MGEKFVGIRQLAVCESVRRTYLDLCDIVK